MSRRRILVAIVPPPEIVDTARRLRRLLGDLRSESIVPHITVVPPVNIETGRFAAIRRHLRVVASTTTPIELEITGVSSFHPSTPTVHFEIAEVGGRRLAELRTALMQGDLERNENRPFRAHITLRKRAEQERIIAALEALSGAGRTFDRWTAETFHLMEQRRSEERGTYWVPIVEEQLGPLTVVGRGGVELVIRSSGTVDPEAAAMLGVRVYEMNQSLDRLAVTAEFPRKVGQPVGVAVGRIGRAAAVLEHIAVRADSRGMGIGRHLVSQWCHNAAVAGAPLAWAEDVEGAEMLSSAGFVPVGDLWVRELG